MQTVGVPVKFVGEFFKPLVAFVTIAHPIFYSAKLSVMLMLLTSRLCSRSYQIASSVCQPHAYKRPRPHQSLYRNLRLEKRHNAFLVHYPGYIYATLTVPLSFGLDVAYVAFANHSAVSGSVHPRANFHVS